MGILIRNILTFQGRKDIYVDKGRIVEKCSADKIIEGENLFAMSGLVQGHVHLCQVPFRGWAENVRLFDWLFSHIFVYESKHTKETLYYGALVGIAEMLLSGVTTIIDMGTTHSHANVMEAIIKSGIRGYSGMSMVDEGENYPENFKYDTDYFIKESAQLLKEYHFKKSPIVGYALSPRFVPSCSEKLLIETYNMSKEYNTVYHTHSAETTDEIRMIKERFNMGNVEYLHHIGVLGDKTVLAHNIYITDEEMDILRDTKTISVHCPSTNLKLGSGVADIRKWLDKGMRSSIGSDGAPCNNQLDIFADMKLAGLLQQEKHYPGAISGREVIDMATTSLNGLFPDYYISGELKPGDTADITIIEIDKIYHPVRRDKDVVLPEYIVYSAKSSDVKYVIINGNIVVDNGRITTFDIEEARRKLEEHIKKVY